MAEQDLIVSIEDAKRYARIDYEDDEDIKRLIKTAEDHIKDVTRSSLKVQTRTAMFKDPGSTLVIEDSNVIAVKKVMGIDNNGVPFQVKAMRDGNTIKHAAGNVQYIEVTYEVYDDHVPEPLKQAALLLIAHLYENRGIISDTNNSEIPFTFQALVAPYRKGFF